MANRVEVEIRRAWCPECDKHVAARKNTTDPPGWGCGDVVLIPATVGIWFVVRVVHIFLWHVIHGSTKWLCPECGLQLNPNEKPPRRPK